MGALAKGDSSIRPVALRRRGVLCLLLCLTGCTYDRAERMKVMERFDPSVWLESRTVPRTITKTALNDLPRARLGKPVFIREADPAPLATISLVQAVVEEQGVTLDQAINATLIADPKIRAGLETINQASGDLLTSSLRPNPTLGVGASLLPLTRPFTADKQGGPPQLDVGVAYPIDWFLFGKRAAAMASAGIGVRVSEADYADLVRLRVTATALAFYDVLEAGDLFKLARDDLESLKQTEMAVKNAKDIGGRAAVDLNRVRLDVVKSQQSLRQAEANLVTAKSRLRALMGRGDADPGFEVSGRLDTEIVAAPMPVEEALAEAVRNRPDIQSFRLQQDKAQADIRVESKKAYPEVTPKFGITRQFQEQAIGFPDASAYGVGLDVTLPFFDRNQGNRFKAQSAAVKSGYVLQSGLVELRSEVEQAVEDLRTAYQNATALAKTQLDLAAQVRDSITEAYKAGGRPLIELLDAQRNYRDIYRSYISGRASYWRAYYRLSSVIGKQVSP